MTRDLLPRRPPHARTRTRARPRSRHPIAGAALAAAAALLPAAAGDAAPEPLQIWISSYQDKVYYEEMVELYRARGGEAAKDFSAQVHAYGFRELPDKLAVAMKTGKGAPDIVQLDEILFGIYLAGPVPFVDLTSRVKAAGLDKTILPSRLGLFAYGGKTYGLPQSLSAMVLYYRTDLFDKHGIQPHQIATWDAFVRKGKELAADGQGLLALDPLYFDILLRQRGSDLIGADGKLFPDPQVALEVLRWLVQVGKDGVGIVPDRASIFDPVFFGGDVANDEVLCVIGADWYGLDMIQQFSPDLAGKWAAMPLPGWVKPDGRVGRRTSCFAGQGLLIYQGCQQVDPAWDFIRFVMTDKDANAQRFLKGNSFPAYRPSFEDKRLLGESTFFNNQRLGALFADLAPDVPAVNMGPLRPQAIFAFQESIFSSMMYGTITPEEAMAEVRKMVAAPGR